MKWAASPEAPEGPGVSLELPPQPLNMTSVSKIAKLTTSARVEDAKSMQNHITMNFEVSIRAWAGSWIEERG